MRQKEMLPFEQHNPNDSVSEPQRVGKCSLCGRRLTNEGSVVAGFGPVCRAKHGALVAKESQESNVSEHDHGDRAYVMARHSGEAVAYVSEDSEDGVYRELPHIVHHSPTGFEWGYGGSGPADLARSILTDAVGQTIADAYYQQFKWDIIAKLPHEGGKIKRSEVLQWLRAHGVGEVA